MDRFNDETNDLIELGSVTAETRGTPMGSADDTSQLIKRVGFFGLSDD